jgi:outer membrane protein assembly factor BamB
MATLQLITILQERNSLMMPRSVLAILAVFALAAASPAADWPGWRGPTGQGISDEKDLPLRWGGPGDENVLWKKPLPGQAAGNQQDQNQSSPIVCGPRVFVTASFWLAGIARKDFPEHHVACYQADDGKLLWDTRVPPGPWKLSDLRGGYTAPTPACDGQHVFVLFGSAVLAALDLEGKIVWRKEIVPHDFDVAIGTSPVLYRDTVLLQCDQISGSSRFMAFDKATGELKWEKKRPDDGFSHSTPVLVNIDGKPQLLTAAAGRIQGVNPDDGTLLWWCGGNGDTVSPVLADGLVYCDSGRGGGPGVAVAPTGTGDVTRNRVWRIERVPEGFSSPVVVDGYVYRLLNPGLLHCWRMKTGAKVYEERLPGVTTPASPISTADGRIYVASAGKSFVLAGGPKFDLLGSSDLRDGAPASPALAGGRLFLKGQHFLYCIGKRER